MMRSQRWSTKDEQARRQAPQGEVHAGVQAGGDQACQGRAGRGGPARFLGVPKANLGNWIRASEKGELHGAGDRPVSAEQMELARLHAELPRVKMERDILKKATAYFAKESL